MDSIYVTLHSCRIGGELYNQVTVIRGEETEISTYRSVGSAQCFESLDEVLSVLDGAVLAWAIGATPPMVAPGGAETS